MPFDPVDQRAERYMRLTRGIWRSRSATASITCGTGYLRYWFDPATGRVFCLSEAPSSQAALAVHREAHGQLPDEIFEVQEFE
jgi:hypothetical protein